MDANPETPMCVDRTEEDQKSSSAKIVKRAKKKQKRPSLVDETKIVRKFDQEIKIADSVGKAPKTATNHNKQDLKSNLKARVVNGPPNLQAKDDLRNLINSRKNAGTSNRAQPQSESNNNGSAKDQAPKTDGGKSKKERRQDRKREKGEQKKKKRKVADLLNDPTKIVEAVLAKASFDKLDLSSQAERRLAEQDVRREIEAMDYHSDRIEMTPQNVISILPSALGDAKVNLSPYAITHLTDINSEPQRRRRPRLKRVHGRKDGKLPKRPMKKRNQAAQANGVVTDIKKKNNQDTVTEK